MCAPGCLAVVSERLNRRRLLGGATLAAAGATLAPAPVAAQTSKSFSRVVDLTHTLHEAFPTFGGDSGFTFEQFVQFADSGYNMARWSLVEHTGTHLDAPIHFAAEGHSSDTIPVADLVAPLAVIDIRAKAAGNADAQVTLDDLKAFEAAHGEIPQNACIAMNAGWDAKVTGDGFRNADDDGVMHFPGFHQEAGRFLMEERQVVGMAVDTLSLDYGPSADFAVHYDWLPSGRWGLECVANLGALPALGATIVVGAPKVRGATGGPTRVLALV